MSSTLSFILSFRLFNFLDFFTDYLALLIVLLALFNPFRADFAAFDASSLTLGEALLYAPFIEFPALYAALIDDLVPLAIAFPVAFAATAAPLAATRPAAAAPIAKPLPAAPKAAAIAGRTSLS